MSNANNLFAIFVNIRKEIKLMARKVGKTDFGFYEYISQLVP